jgi:hypothetical protein
VTVNRTELARVEVDNSAIDGTGLPVRVTNLIPGGLGGDASAANQLLENASLASIDSKLPALSGGRVPVELPAGGGGLTDTELRATPVPVSGPLTDAQLRALAVAISAAALPLPAGATTEATLLLVKAAVETIDNFISGARGLVTEDNSAAILTKLGDILTELAQKTEPANAQHVIVDSSAAIAVTGPLTDAQLRATPVPVSGTVTITDGSGPVTVDGTVAVSSSALPAGAATDAGLASILAELQQKLEPADIATLATSAKQDTGNTSLASLVASLALLTLAQASDGAAAQGPMVQALADDAPPQRITGLVYPLSLTADGRLRTANAPSHADHDFWGDMEPAFGLRQNDFWRSLPAYYSY